MTVSLKAEPYLLKRKANHPLSQFHVKETSDNDGIFMLGAHLFCAQNKEKYNYYCLDEKNLQAILGGIQKVDVIYESRLQ